MHGGANTSAAVYGAALGWWCGKVDMTEDGFDDDVPLASPEIRESYEAALGRFILAFNQVDNVLSKVIAIILDRLGREDLIPTCSTRDFPLKCLVLDLLKVSTEGAGIADVPVKLMRTIAGERNILAHGHFDQNPFDGSYDVVAKNVRAQYSVERLNGLSKQATEVWTALNYSLGFYVFSDPPTR